MPDPAEDLFMGTDYLGQQQPLTIGGRDTLPVGGASLGAGPAAAAVGGPAGAAAGPSAGVPVGQAASRPTGQGALNDLRTGLRGVDIARRFASNIPGAPLGVPTSDILEGGPSGSPVYGPSRATAPSPTFGGPAANEGLSGALETSVPMGADAAGGGIADWLGPAGAALKVGTTALGWGLNPEAGGAPVGEGDELGGLAMAASFANPATMFATVGLAGLGGILETAGVLGKSDYTRARERDADYVHEAVPDFIGQIMGAQSPEELAGLFRSGFAGPGEKGRLTFDFQPDYSDIATSGLRLKQPQIEQVNVALEQAAQYQMAVLEGARMGNPQAIELLQSATQAQQGRRDAATRAQAEWDAAAPQREYEAQTMNVGSA